MASGHAVLTGVLKRAETRRNNQRHRITERQPQRESRGVQVLRLLDRRPVAVITLAQSWPPCRLQDLQLSSLSVADQSGLRRPTSGPAPRPSGTYAPHRCSRHHSPLCSCRTETFGKTRSFYARRRRRGGRGRRSRRRGEVESNMSDGGSDKTRHLDAETRPAVFEDSGTFLNCQQPGGVASRCTDESWSAGGSAGSEHAGAMETKLQPMRNEPALETGGGSALTTDY